MDVSAVNNRQTPWETRDLMLEHDPHVCFLLDEHCRVLDCNTEAVIFFGQSGKTETCAYIGDKLIKDRKENLDPDKPSLRERFRVALELGHCAFETVLSVGRKPVPVDIIMKRLPEAEHPAVAVYMNDITDQKESGAKMTARGELLQTVNTMAGLLMDSEPEKIEDTIHKSLDIFLKLLDADRVSICEASAPDEKSTARRPYTRVSRYYKISNQIKSKEPCDAEISDRLYDLLRSGQTVNGPVRELPLEDQKTAKQRGVRSVLMIPMQHEGLFWGYISFEDCRHDRCFTSSEEQTMRSTLALLASALIRNAITETLRQTKQELMERDYLLRGVHEAAALLLGNYQYDFMRTVRQSLMVLGNAVNGERFSIWRNRKDADGELYSERFAGWIFGKPIDEDVTSASIPLLHYVPQWKAPLRSAITINRSEMNENLLSMSLLEFTGTLLLIPLDIRGEFWGFAGISRRDEYEKFPQSQINLLRSGSMMVVSAIKREENKQELIDAREKALAQSARQQSFLAHISREIRTPLNTITGMTAVARQNPDAVEWNHYLESVDDSSRCILTAINQLLVNAGPAAEHELGLRNLPLDLRAFLQHVHDSTRHITDQRQQILSFSYPKQNSRYIITDEQRLRQLLDNLLENASKFTPIGGRVSLTAEIEEESRENGRKGILHVTIADTGIGIDEAQIALLRNPPDEESPRRNHTGLSGYGLLLCRGIVESMEGEIHADAEPGGGSRFSFRVCFEWGRPIVGKVLTADEGSSTGRYTRDWGRFRILLAEDVDINAEVITAMLANTGVSIEIVRDGRQAILAYQAAPEDFHLIIMDVQMPVMDGIKVAKMIRSSSLPGSRTIPIIAVTANSFEADLQSTAKAGFDRHLSKPADIDELFETLDYYFGTEMKKERL